MKSNDDFKYMDIETYTQIIGSSDGYEELMKELNKDNEIINLKTLDEIKPVILEKKTPIKNIDSRDMYILKLQLRVGRFLTKEENMLSQDEKLDILMPELQKLIDCYKSYNKSEYFIRNALKSVIGKNI